MKNKFWEQILDHPNITIVTVGAVLSGLFYLLGATTAGDASSLFLNLSAGMIGVVLIVILVDTLRNLSLEKKKGPSRKEAIRLIKASHINLVMLVATARYRREFGTAFIEAGELMNQGDPDSLTTMTNTYALRLADEEPADLLDGFNSTMVESLRSSVTKLSDSIKDIRSNYSFSIDDTLNRHLSDMMSGLNFTSGTFSSFDLTSANLGSFTDSPPELFVGIGLHTYLKAYKKFLNKY